MKFDKQMGRKSTKYAEFPTLGINTISVDALHSEPEHPEKNS